jgi:sugar lactone lactonase YvrE
MRSQTDRMCFTPRGFWPAVALLLVALALVGASPASSQESSGDGTRAITLLPAGTNPEGVAFDENTGFFYVSTVGDGTIYRGTPDRRVARPFLPGGEDGRSTAVGVKVDDEGLLYIAGGATGRIFVYDTETRELVARFGTGAGGFINDLIVTEDGDVYATDSFRPFVYRVSAEDVEAGGGSVERIPVGPEIRYRAGFNLNGIAITENGRHLVLVQSNTGKLFRLTPRAAPGERRIRGIPVQGGPLRTGDGILTDGGQLLVVQNGPELVTEVALTREALRGEVVRRTTDRTFKTPTTAAFAGNRLLVVNSEFSETDGPPFTVSNIRRPG